MSDLKKREVIKLIEESEKTISSGKEYAEMSIEDLEDLETFILDVFSSVPIPLYIVNPASIIIEMNRALAELTGYKRVELVGKPTYLIFVDKEEAKNTEKETMEKGFVKNRELSVLTKDKKEISVNISTSARKDKSGDVTGYVATLMDITELKRLIKKEEEATAWAATVTATAEEAERTKKSAEAKAKELGDFAFATLNILEDVEETSRRLEKAYKELKSLDKMKDEFLSMTSHELKTPLTSMISFTQLMLDEKLGKLTEEQGEALGIISDDIKRLRNSVEKVVEISRIDSGRMKLNLKNLRAEDLIQRAVKNMLLTATQKQIVITQKIDKLPLVRADEGYLDMVITNLLDNAIKFTPKRGEVTIEAERGDGHVLVKVKDTGVGIAPENVPQLFAKFFQANHSTSGSGLGLYICKTIVEAHGGKIWAESQPPNGSTFYFTLPLVKHAEEFKNMTTPPRKVASNPSEQARPEK